MGHNLLELPLDVLRTIWNNLSLPDVLRFGMTAKNMLDLTWTCCQEISIEHGWPINVFTSVLARDLSHVCNLYLVYQPSEQAFQFEKTKVPLLLQQLESLKHSKLTNLHSLTVDFNFPDKKFKKSSSSVNGLILKNSQLNMLNWYTAEVEQNFNIGQFFIDHTRLTTLRIRTNSKLIGVNLLTQLKSLGLSFCDNLDDAMWPDVMGLTQLQCLEIAHNSSNITDQSFTKITNLTNLQRLVMHHNPGIKSTSLKLLYSLPNLSNLTLTYPWDFNQEEYLADASFIGQLSHLTRLSISNFDGNLDFGYLTKLTTLMELEIDTKMETAELSHFTNLTSFVFRGKGFKMAALPPSLEHLGTSNEVTEENITTICGLTKLKRFECDHNNFNATLMARWITQLTRLTALVMLPIAPKELIPSLERLPNLGSLLFSDAPSDDTIDDFTKLTQVMELTYWRGYRKDLKARLPFNIVFIGDPNEEDEEAL